MTMIVKCDECGREEIVKGYLPFGWHSETRGSTMDGIKEKQICPDCWEKVFMGAKE